MRVPRPTRLGGLAPWWLGLACFGCGGPTDGRAPCTTDACSAECIAGDAYAGICLRDACHCLGPPDGGAEDADAAEADDVALPPCDGFRVPLHEVPGAAPGMVCRQVSASSVEKGLLDFAGDGGHILLCGDQTLPVRLWAYDRAAQCISLLDDLADFFAGHPDAGAAYPSVDGDWAAYSVAGKEAGSDISVWQIRLVDIPSRRIRVLREIRGASPDPVHIGGPAMDNVTLRYPWVVWRDVRPENSFRWYAYAYNIETGEERNLSIAPEGAPADESGMWGSVVWVDLLGDIAVFDGGWGGGTEPLAEEIIRVDLGTGEAGPITSDPAAQFHPVITPEWIVWLDQRAAPSYHPPFPCGTDIYGLDRGTGEERGLVTAPSMQGPWMDGEGDWLLYEDQRDGSDVACSLDREEDMYAYHLPTGTEIRVTDWPGFEMYPKVYDRHDGTFGALFLQELDYGGAIYRLWDCDLAAPPASGTDG